VLLKSDFDAPRYPIGSIHEKKKRKERWNNPLKEKEEREMEAFIISFSK
jgi:hypothetical protein